MTGIITGRSRVGEDIAEKIVNLFAFAVERPSNLCCNCTFSNTSFTGKDQNHMLDRFHHISNALR